MSDPYIGEIRMFGGTFAPLDWEFCDGQLMPISENEALFQLIGTTYGGDGESTFALPNLQGRIPLHMGTGPSGTTYQLGELSGTEWETLTVQQIPSHTHPLTASTADGTSPNPQDSLLAQTPAGIFPYFEDTPTTQMAAGAITIAGSSQPHENTQPFLCVNFIIATSGIFPPPS